MESDLGKLFIGGISWDTHEEQLRDYFQAFGDVVESVIMKDRTTGRARGFGFVVFADPAVAERVVMEKHAINGRVVEAKKAVPRDGQRNLNRNGVGGRGSPGPSPTRTKKIFVGGLPSTVTESEFKKYFDQFGAIMDVVVMYDHQTQRPRGFGFITFDSEDAVDRVLYKTFHELNGKMVEVKKAVPKELSPGPSMRSPLGAYNYGLNRVSSNILNGYAQGHNLSPISGYGMRVDGRFGPVSGVRSSFDPFGSLAYGMGMNCNPSASPSLNGGMGYGSGIGGLSPYFSGNSNRLVNSLGYRGNDGGIGPTFSLNSRTVWDNGGFNSNGLLAGSGTGNVDGIANNSCMNWGNSASNIAAEADGSGAGYNNGNLDYGNVEKGYGFLGSTYRRNISVEDINTSFTPKRAPYDGAYADLYEDGSLHGDPTWRSVSSKLDCSNPFEYGLDTMPYDNGDRGPGGDSHSYSFNNRQQNRGIVAYEGNFSPSKMTAAEEILVNQMNA